MRAPSGIPAQTIADLLDWKYATMMSELSGQPGHKLGAERILPLLDVTGSDAPLHFLARERGGVFVKLPQVEGPLEPVTRQCLVAMREFGELVGATSDALVDGAISPEEAKHILRLGHEAVTAVMALLKVVEARPC
ncbi:phage regulatory CII family protein [Fundidesulfovibrio magnetotacticus]|uniref:phage regulatory CII family protein n=1 Tax=Fundidesulfovibrio magnetotacticus TaxID=2730080 RepID=UPI001F256070|nr:phage regulatory CII family protein [Fundidesulfovibrio magnetotacticus]